MTLRPPFFFLILILSLNGTSAEQKTTHAALAQTGTESWTKTNLKRTSRLKLRVSSREYLNFKSFIKRERKPLLRSFKIPQWLNAFDYYFEPPTKEEQHPVKISSEIAPCPWNMEDDLLMIKMKGSEFPNIEPPPINFVFVLDGSESMNGERRVELFKNNLRELTAIMRDKDQISLISYNVKPSVFFKHIPGKDKEKLLDEINHIWIGRSGGKRSKGIKTAYKIIADNFDPSANNRVIIISDGDWNIGIGNENSLFEYIADKRKEGIYLSALGFDTNNDYDSLMIKMAINGGGNYAYVNNEKAARAVFKADFLGIDYLIGRKAKLEIDFNTTVVSEYDLFGYGDGKLANGQYKSNYFIGDDLTMEQELIAFYQLRKTKDHQGDIGYVNFEYTPVQEDTILTFTDTLIRTGEPSIDFNFGSSIIQYCENYITGKNRGKEYILSAIERAKNNLGTDSESRSYKKREEFIILMEASLEL